MEVQEPIAVGSPFQKEDDEGESQEQEEEQTDQDAEEDLKLAGEIESTFDLKFCPPVYIQRYNRVSGVVQQEIERDGDELPRTILEVGSAECKMFKYLKMIPLVEKVIMMDIDKELLESHKHTLRPLPFEHLKKRETPLTLEVYSGCVTKVDSRVLNAEPKIYAIIAIEIIEHLDPEIGVGFEETLFSTIAPPIIVITTPNSEYNEAFKLEKGKFRHWDHRFEWTRQEFKDWCDKMSSKYPSYTYKVEGIGPGPPKFEHLGHVSQMAVFRKNASFAEICKDAATCDKGQLEENTCYELITREEFPFFKDPAPIEEQILREFKIFVSLFLFSSSALDELEMEEKTEIMYPLDYVKDISTMPRLTDATKIRGVLEEAGYAVRPDENGQLQVVLPVPPREEEEHSSDDEDGYYDDAAPFGIADENPGLEGPELIDDYENEDHYDDYADDLDGENWD